MNSGSRREGVRPRSRQGGRQWPPPPCGPELRRILEATAEADWPQDVRVALGEKVAEIRQLGEGQGDRGLVRAREAAYTLLGGATPEWVANQEMRHQKERDALREEAQRPNGK